MALQPGCPRLQPEPLDLGELGRSRDLLGHTGQQHAPAGPREHVPAVGLEGDHVAGGPRRPGSRPRRFAGRRRRPTTTKFTGSTMGAPPVPIATRPMGVVASSRKASTRPSRSSDAPVGPARRAPVPSSDLLRSLIGREPPPTRGTSSVAPGWRTGRVERPLSAGPAFLARATFGPRRRPSVPDHEKDEAEEAAMELRRMPYRLIGKNPGRCGSTTLMSTSAGSSSAAAVGRVGFVLDGEAIVVPVNHAVDGRTILFRTGATALLEGLAGGSSRLRGRRDRRRGRDRLERAHPRAGERGHGPARAGSLIARCTVGAGRARSLAPRRAHLGDGSRHQPSSSRAPRRAAPPDADWLKLKGEGELIGGEGGEAPSGSASSSRSTSMASSFGQKPDSLISGLRFDLSTLVDNPSAIASVPLFLVLFLVCRGVPALLFRKQLDKRATIALALLSATSLSFVLTATDVGIRVGKLREINATAMVGAAVIAMVLFPLGAQALLARTETEPSAEKADLSGQRGAGRSRHEEPAEVPGAGVPGRAHAPTGPRRAWRPLEARWSQVARGVEGSRRPISAASAPARSTRSAALPAASRPPRSATSSA